MLHLKFEGNYNGELLLDAEWDSFGFIEYKNDLNNMLQKLIASSSGMFGHIIGDGETTPADVFNAAKQIEKDGNTVEYIKVPNQTTISIPEGVES